VEIKENVIFSTVKISKGEMPEGSERPAVETFFVTSRRNF